jgi:pimeloyl-ACP methyl ester carboxylesterase
VDHAISVLEALGLRQASLVGHSEGAFIATRIAITRPDLASRLVLITSGGTAPALGGEADEGWMEASRRAYDYRSFPGSAAEFLATARLRNPGMDAYHATLLRESYDRALTSGQAAMMRALHRDGPTDYRAYVRLQEEHLFPHLPELAIPTLLIRASDDATVPVERGIALMRRFPRADLHVLAGSTHAVLHERAEAVTCLLAGFCAGEMDAYPPADAAGARL